MISKDKPEGGVLTGPTRHGLLGLAHKHYQILFLAKN